MKKLQITSIIYDSRSRWTSCAENCVEDGWTEIESNKSSVTSVLHFWIAFFRTLFTPPNDFAVEFLPPLV